MDVPWGTLLGAGGPWAIVAFMVISLFTSVLRGWLVPGATVDRLTSQAEQWRLAYERAEEARRLQAEQVNQLLEFARTADVILRALPSPNSSATTREPAS